MVSGNDAVTIPGATEGPLSSAWDADIDSDITEAAPDPDMVSGGDSGDELSAVLGDDPVAISQEIDTAGIVEAVDRLNVSVQAGFAAMSLLLGLIIGIILIRGFFVWRS